MLSNYLTENVDCSGRKEWETVSSTFYRPIGIFMLENFVLIFARMSGVK